MGSPIGREGGCGSRRRVTHQVAGDHGGCILGYTTFGQALCSPMVNTGRSELASGGEGQQDWDGPPMAISPRHTSDGPLLSQCPYHPPVARAAQQGCVKLVSFCCPSHREVIKREAITRHYWYQQRVLPSNPMKQENSSLNPIYRGQFWLRL